MLGYGRQADESTAGAGNLGGPAELVPLGDRAWLARFADEMAARRWCLAVRELSEPGVADVVLAYRAVAVHADPDRCDLDALETRLKGVASVASSEAEGRIHALPVLYDGADLPEVASIVGLSVEAVIEAHSRPVYDIFAIGFQPGFPYAGYLGPPLDRLPRRERPRLKVPAGSVAVAARQTGVYPTELPGGWNLIGRTPLVIADLAAGYFPIEPGDRLRFEPIGPDEFRAREGQRL